MRRTFILGVPVVAAGVACLVVYGCVGDAAQTVVDAGGDAAGDAAASCVPIPPDPGVACFNAQRCKAQSETCCTGLSGNGLIGDCKPIAAGDAASCTLPLPVPWPCDKAYDCPAQAGKCCATDQGQKTLISALNTGDGGCPVQLKVDPPDGAVDAAAFTFSVSYCATGCGGNFQLCSSASECGSNLRCIPVQFNQPSFAKTFGVCVP